MTLHDAAFFECSLHAGCRLLVAVASTTADARHSCEHHHQLPYNQDSLSMQYIRALHCRCQQAQATHAIQLTAVGSANMLTTKMRSNVVRAVSGVL
jgi:hypothetical protein